MCSVLLLFIDSFCSLLHCYKALSTLYIRLWISSASIAVRAPTQASEHPTQVTSNPPVTCLQSCPRFTKMHWEHLLTYCRRPCHHSGFPSVKGVSPVSFLSFYLVFFFPFFLLLLSTAQTLFLLSVVWKSPVKYLIPPERAGKSQSMPRVWRQLSRIEASNA